MAFSKTSHSSAHAKRVPTLVAFLLFSLLLIAGVLSISSTAAKAETPDADQPTISSTGDNPVRVAFFPLDGFYEYDASGNMSGYGVEYFNAVADTANISYEYVPAASWVEALEMFDEGKVDVLAPSEMTAERSAKYRFCPLPIGMEYGSLLTSSDNDSLTYEDYPTFDGMKVGCVQSIVFMDRYLDYEQNNGFGTQLEYYEDTQAVLDALKAGEVDAVMVNLMVKTDDMKVLAKFGAAPIYYMVSPDNPQLQSTLNDALESFTTTNPSFQADLTDKYFASFNESPFTKQELEFAASCGVVNVGIATDAAPLAHFDSEGNACGVDVEILNAIAQNSGIRFNYVALPKGVVDEAYLIDHDIAMVAGVESNAVNAKHVGLHLSKPYQTLTKIYVGDPSRSFDPSSPLRVAVAAESGDSIEALSMEHPDYQFTQYNTTEECLDAVQNGSVDVVFQNRYLIERCLSNPHYSKLASLPIEPESVDYAFALVDPVVNSTLGADKLDLFKSVIDKSISQIPEQTISGFLATEAAENQYRPTFSDMVYQYRWQLLVIIISLLCVFAALGFATHIQARNRRRIQDNEQKLSNITNNVNGGVLVINGDDSLLITFANEGFLELIGCTREEFEEVHHNSYLTYVHPDDAPALREFATKHIDEKGERVSFPLRLRQDEGTYLDTLFNGTIRLASDGSRQMYCVVTDISEQVSLLNQLTLEKNRADLFFQKSDNAIYEVNVQDMTITTSENMLAMLGWSLPSSIKRFGRDEFMSMWRTDQESKEMLFEVTKKLLDQKVDVKCTIPLQAASGESIWCEIGQYPVTDTDGTLVSVVGRILDVDETVVEKLRLEHLARTDTMTGLLKKEAFVEDVRAYLATEPTDNCALLFFDVDHFKEVNDTLGHELGDTCLKDVAQVLGVAFAGVDLIGRFGGDEFVVFVKKIPKNTLVDKLEWLQKRLQQEYGNGQKSMTLSCSIGGACTEDFGLRYDTLLKHADEAVYKAKNEGRARFVMAPVDVN